MSLGKAHSVKPSLEALQMARTCHVPLMPAERLAQSLLKAREAPHTPEEMEAWREKRQAFEQGQLSPAAARNFVKQQRESYLERQFKYLQYTEAVRVYGVATEQEKPLLNRLLREKRQNLIRRHAMIRQGSD